MGQAISTTAFFAKAAAVAGSTATVVTGDSLTVPNFPSSATARLAQLFRHDETGGKGFVQLKSPNLANSTTGIKVYTAESPSVQLLPPAGSQKLISGDTLTAVVGAAATATKYTVGAFLTAYSTLPGATQKLHSWGDISGAILQVYSQSVAVTGAATPAWKDTLTNATADLMEAGSFYALLGYSTDVALALVGLKSPETSTRRICGPGSTISADTSDYFVQLSSVLGVPAIPVVNADNRGNINVSVIAATASTVATVTLIWAQLAGSFA